MKKLCVFFILIGAVSLHAQELFIREQTSDVLEQTVNEDIKDNETIENEKDVTADRFEERQGFQKPKPCKKPPCLDHSKTITGSTNPGTEQTNPTTEANESVTKPYDSATEATESVTKSSDSVTEATESVTKPSDSVTEATQSVTKPSDSAMEATESVTKPSNSVTVPTEPMSEQTKTIMKPAKPTPDNRPTFVTTSAPPVTKPKLTSKPLISTKRPRPDHWVEGSIVFPDSDMDWGPKPTPRPKPTPKPEPTTTPEPTPRPKPTSKPKPAPTPSPKPDHDEYEPDKDEEPSNQDEVKKCMQKCYMTAEDDPVCGNNGVTYINQGHFACARKCGVAVDTFSRGSCRNNSSDAEIKQCLTQCPVTTEYSPVCGTDGQTYLNDGLLVCAKYCGLAVELQSRGPCPGFTSAPSTTESTSPDETKEPDTTTMSEEQRQCIRKCPVTAEYAPVCGTNSVTYANPGRLICAKECGVAVDVFAKGVCRTTTPSATLPTIIRTTTPSFIQKACMSRCHTTPENNPVCGTDMVTYKNPAALNCVRYCLYDVQKLSNGECPKIPRPTTEPPLDPEKDTSAPPDVTSVPTPTTPSTAIGECIRRCPVTQEYNPVCGTNYVIYHNLGRLNCAQTCGVDVKLLRRGRCPLRPTTSTVAPLTTSTTTAASTTTQSAAANECVNKCPVTSEYNPVCGTNYVTYKNPGQLYCAQIFCNVDVNLLRDGPCPQRPAASTAVAE